MESLVGIVIMVLFALFSLAAKGAKREQQQRQQTRGQQWPGPVAGPGMPGFPRSQFPPQQRTAPQPPPPAPLAVEDPEGVGTEGPGSVSAEEEGSRFDRDTTRNSRVGLEEIMRGADEVAREADAIANAEPAARQLGELKQQGVLEPAEAIPAQFALSNLQQAVLMAEVLGRPRAARNMRRYGRR